jgi:hypothetical protein
MSCLYKSEEEIEQVVRGFETCTTPAANFHHREHLVVAVWYLQTFSPRDTVARMRSALLRFLDHHGVDRGKYSDDITLFWVDTVARYLEGIAPAASLVDKCNQVVESFSSTAQRPRPPAQSANPEIGNRQSKIGNDSSSPAHTPASRVEDEGSLVKS